MDSSFCIRNKYTKWSTKLEGTVGRPAAVPADDDCHVQTHTVNPTQPTRHTNGPHGDGAFDPDRLTSTFSLQLEEKGGHVHIKSKRPARLFRFNGVAFKCWNVVSRREGGARVGRSRDFVYFEVFEIIALSCARAAGSL